MSGIYDDPEVYRIACAYRDIPAEADALLAWAARHRDPGPGGPGPEAGPSSVLELAAGPAEHALELARRGLRATALDLNPAMCAWAAGRAAAAGRKLDVVEADMRDFTLASGAPDASAPDASAPEGRVDLAITMLNSACHLFTLDDMVAHLLAVARAVVPGGIYVMELAHPADYLSPAARTSNEWTIEEAGLVASVRWGGAPDAIDPVTQVTREHVSIAVTRPDGTTRTVTDVVPNRFWTATEVTAAIRLAGGFEIAATYGDFDETTPVSAPEAWRLILVLRRDS
ncbi:MAG TPA: methyltransferase domain-containing protein [Trebonia sp.]|nr:methyltransferase domain-containing protein [Trebonia sp.]